MKLISLEMNNFRQYYGKQIIRFATEKERNTTIIFGENGGGKTGIYRALMFVLFGSKTISQDGIGGTKVHLTNLKALDEGLYEPASVTLNFEHEDRLFEIKRTLNSSKIGNLLHETIDSQQLIEIDLETGNTLPNIVAEEDEVKDFINKIINEEIKDFFLFDAEKIDTLAKTDVDVRREVKNAIFSLLQIDKLDKAREIVNDLSNKMSYKIVRASKSGTVKQIDEQLKETVEKIQEQKEKKDLLENEIENLNNIIEENQIILKKNQEISLKKERIKTKESNVNNLKYQLKTTKSNISNALFQEAPSLLVNATLKKNQRFLNEFLGENKINIPSDLIEKSLNDECCVLCNNDLSDHAKMHLKRLQDYENDAESFELARMLLHYCEGKTENFERDNINLKNNMKNYNNILNEMEDEEQEIKGISKEIAEQARNDVNLIDVQRMIDADNNKRDDLIGQLHLVNTNLNEITMKKEELERELERLFEIEKESKHEQRQVSLLKALTNELKGIKKEFSEEIRNLLGQNTTEVFRKLIDQKDLEVIDKVVINHNFEIEARNKKGYIITQDISQGQRQILALSFITSLAKLAVRENTIEQIDYPLFMDSPFNRLSAKNRDNLIERIPDLTAQWILLVTDTEMTVSEERVFKKTGKLGKWYRINQIEPSFSKIEEVSLNDSIATRGGL